MFRSRYWPRGVFGRGRLDFRLDLAMTLELESVSSGNGMTNVALYNDAKDGRRLAIMAILAWTTAQPPIVWCQVQQGVGSVQNGTTVPLVGNAGVQPGIGYTAQPAASSGTPPVAKFIADGKTWFRHPDAPLYILQPGTRYELFAGVAPNGYVSRPNSLIATFIWVPA